MQFLLSFVGSFKWRGKKNTIKLLKKLLLSIHVRNTWRDAFSVNKRLFVSLALIIFYVLIIIFIYPFISFITVTPFIMQSIILRSLESAV